MPWHITRDHAGCGVGKFAVVKDDDGEVEGCHDSEGAAKKQLAALYANEPDAARSDLGMDIPTVQPVEFIRAVTLDDIRIRAGGTGRTVEAYAAIFDEEAEVYDQDGHYLERNAPGAFNQTITHQRGRFPVVYHHGLTIAGTPSERGSVPIGVSTEVKVDKRGVLTISEYAKTDLANEVLEAIRMGSVTAQSYGGKFIKSDPRRRPPGGYRADPAGRLRTVTRQEIAMREFGPTPFPAFAGAAITGIRAQQVLGALLTAPPEQRETLLHQLDGLSTPSEAEAQHVDTSTVEGVEETEEAPVHSARSMSLRQRVRVARITRGME